MGKAGERFKKALWASHRPANYIKSQADKKEAEERLKHAQQMREEGMALVNQLNWEPDYVADLIGPYQKAESPIARAFLESLLTGDNPSSVPSTRHGANRLRAGAQARFDDRFGGWDELYARQREIERETPWAPKKFSAPAVQKLPPPPAPAPRPAWEAAVKADPNGQTPEGSAALQEMWGFDDDYWKRLEAATGRPVPRTLGGG